ncbi:MAG TPA: dethiobiotin synthase [Methylocella sp.]|nr:dethiobiotin synthase [Methylocella sp.]
MPAIFITGSGTGVGKTFVACGLITHFRALGRPVGALKPLVSGFDPAALIDSDPAMLLEALGRSVTADELQQISPWRFCAPLSPDMAARAEGRSIDFQRIVDFCRAEIAKTAGTLLIEGIGGIMVPLDRRHTVLDLMAALGQPVVLVGGSYLGTLSHVLSAQDVILHHGLGLRAIVISESEGTPPPLRETLVSLGNFISSPLIGLVRQVPEAQNRAAFQRLAELIA